MTSFFVAAFYLLLSSISCQAALRELDNFSVNTLDGLVHDKLYFFVVHRMNDSVSALKQLSHDCPCLFNYTADNCKLNQSIPSPSNPPPNHGGNNFLEKAIGIIYEILKDIAKNVASPKGIKSLGKQAATNLVRDISSVAENVESSLLDGANSAFSSSVDGLKHFGDELKSLTSTIENIAGSLDHLLTDQIGGALSNVGSGFVDGAKEMLSGISSGATDVAKDAFNTIGSGIGSISHSIGHVFGRKRSPCPECHSDKINSQNGPEIVSTVCGSDIITRYNATLNELIHMGDIRSAACNTTIIIQKVEYDPNSIDIVHGVQFKVVYVTYTINGESRRYRPASPLRFTDFPTMADGVSMEIFDSYV